MKGIIYKAINLLTNEVYIGATLNSMDERIKDHTIKANNNSGYKLQQAIATYGIDSFSWEQIDTAASSDELAAKEIKYISDYNSVDAGYNSDKGGGFKKTVYQYNLDGSLINSFMDLTSAANAINATKKAISKACWNVNHTLGNYLWSYDYKEPFLVCLDKRKKQVIQYNLKFEEIARYHSASEASRKTGISKSCITKCCRGERKHSGGFLWQYD